MISLRITPARQHLDIGICKIYKQCYYRGRAGRLTTVNAENDESQQNEPTPVKKESTFSSSSEEPIWVRREREREIIAKEGKDLPFGLYLLLSSFVAIAAVGSVFEYVNRHAIFDVVQPDDPLWAPILGLFAITGLPTSGFLFHKAVSSANKEAERMDRMDGL